MRRLFAVVACALLALPGVLGAQEVKLPEGVKEIKTDELKAKMDVGGKLAVINSLSPSRVHADEDQGGDQPPVRAPAGRRREAAGRQGG